MRLNKSKIISIIVLITLLASAIVIPIYGFTPTLTGRITGSGSPNYLDGANGVYVLGNYAYVTSMVDDSLTIINISTPSSPTVVGHIAGAGDPNYLDGACGVFVSGNYAYVTSLVDDSLTIINITTPASPTFVGHIAGSGAPNYLDQAKDVYVVGNYAYVVSYGNASLTIIDISVPATPTLAGNIRGSGAPNYLGGASGIFVSGNYAYVAAAIDNSLTIIDISVPATPTFGSNIAGSGAPNYLTFADDVFVSGNYAYVAVPYTDYSLTVIDVTNPLAPSFEGYVSSSIYLQGGDSVFVSGSYAYVVAVNSYSLTIIDISVPATPTIVGTVLVGAGLQVRGGIFVSGNYAYVAEYQGDALSIYDAVLGAPVITATDASAISTTTAQLNAHIVEDGNDGGNCQVRWGYGTTSFADPADFESYDTKIPFAGTYSEGENPFYSAASLVISTTYYYRVQIKNAHSTVTSDEITFDTLTVVDDVTIFNGIPNKTSISLHFIMPGGASKVMIRADTDDYPATTADGTQVFFNSGTTTSHEPLPAGTTYYYSIWGEDGGTYSVNALNLVMTTLGAEMTPTGGDSLPTPTLPPHQDPDVGVGSPFSHIEPIYSLVKNSATSLGMPMETLTAIGALLIIAAIALFILIGARSVSGALLVSAVLMSLCIPMKILPWEFVGLSIPMALGAWATSKGEGSNI